MPDEAVDRALQPPDWVVAADFMSTDGGLALTYKGSGNNSAWNLNRRFVHAIQGVLTQIPDTAELSSKPLDLDCKLPIPPRLRLYLFKATQPQSERKSGTHRVQVTVGRKGARTYLDRSGDRSVILAGYVSDWDVFILWDAGLVDARGISYSRNLQCDDETVLQSLSRRIATGEKQLKGLGRNQTVVVARAQYLEEALVERIELTRRALAAS